MYKKLLRTAALLGFKQNDPLSTSGRGKYKTGWTFPNAAQAITKGRGKNPREGFYQTYEFGHLNNEAL